MFYDSVPAWASASGSPDLVFKNITTTSHSLWNLPSYNNPGLPASDQVYIDMVDQGKYSGIFGSISPPESITTKLKMPLQVGETYVVSFDAGAVYPDGNRCASPETSPFVVKASTSVMNQLLPGHTSILAIPQLTSFQIPITRSGNMTWHHQSYSFQAAEAYEYIGIYSLNLPTSICPTTGVMNYIDNVSIKKAVPANSISGVIYNDLNGNGSKDNNESGINGVQVGLFNPAGSTPQVPIQIATAYQYVANGIPQNGFYEFPLNGQSVPLAANYYVALMNEAAYSNISEPALNNLFPPKTHPVQVPFASGGTVINKNLGVLMNGQVVTPTCASPNTSIPFPFLQLNDRNDPDGALRGYCKNVAANSPVPESSTCCVNVLQTFSSPLVVSLSKTLGCTNADNAITANVSGGVPGYTYTWVRVDAVTSAATPLPYVSATADHLVPGNYAVRVTDSTGQVVTSSATTIDPYVSMSLSTQVTPASNSPDFNNGSIKVTVRGGVPGYTYYWSDLSPMGPSTIANNTRAGINGSATNAYSVYVKDGRGCTSPTVSNLKVYNKLTAKSWKGLSCLTGAGKTALVITPSGGHPPYSYQWSNGATGSSLIDAPVGTYSVTVKDSTNAATQKAVLNNLQVTSTLPAMHTVAVRAINATGPVNNGSAVVSTSGGIGPYIYTFAPGLTYPNVSGTSLTQTALAARAYTVTVQTSQGCSVTKPFTINRTVKALIPDTP